MKRTESKKINEENPEEKLKTNSEETESIPLNEILDLIKKNILKKLIDNNIPFSKEPVPAVVWRTWEFTAPGLREINPKKNSIELTCTWFSVEYDSTVSLKEQNIGEEGITYMSNDFDHIYLRSIEPIKIEKEGNLYKIRMHYYCNHSARICPNKV